MEYCKVPPGDDPMADAFNLMVCSWIARHQPNLTSEAERMAKSICRSVTDWEAVAAGLSFLAAEFGNFADKALLKRLTVRLTSALASVTGWRLRNETLSQLS